jgi:hypothetical protein
MVWEGCIEWNGLGTKRSEQMDHITGVAHKAGVTIRNYTRHCQITQGTISLIEAQHRNHSTPLIKQASVLSEKCCPLPKE